MRRADEGDDAARLACDLRKRLLGRLDEARAEQEILRRIPGDRELGEEDDVCARVLRLAQPREDPLPVPVEVSDRRVDLSECESHRFSTMSLNIAEERASALQADRVQIVRLDLVRAGDQILESGRARRGCSGRRARPTRPRRARARAAARAPAASREGRRRQRLGHLRLDETGTDRRRRDPAAQLVRERLARSGERPPCWSRRRCRSRPRQVRGAARDVHDPAASALEHPGNAWQQRWTPRTLTS